MKETRLERHGSHTVYVLEDRDAGSSARVLADFGFNCYSFRCRSGSRECELLRTQDHFADEPARASGNGTPILFPFPNRIRGGQFAFGGKTYQLTRNERGANAIHGLIIDRPWRVAGIDEKTAAVTGEFQLTRDAPELRDLWPADFVIAIEYRVEGKRLTSRVRISNPGQMPLPWGFGTHPYFRVPFVVPSEPHECVIEAPVTERWELEDLIPTGRRQPLDRSVGLDGTRPFTQLKFDDVFTGLQFQEGWCRCRVLDRTAGLALVYRFDRFFRELVIYTPPDHSAICFEPYTCITDAINLQSRGIDAGLRVLAPGESAEGTMILELETLP
jgi:aldose 1-epimerase